MDHVSFMRCLNNTKIQYNLLDTCPDGHQIESWLRLIFIPSTCKYCHVVWSDYRRGLGFDIGFINLLTYGAELFLRSCQLCSYSRISQHFMEPECSLPSSHETSNGHYLEPARSSPYHPTLPYFSKIYFNIIHPPTFWYS
jgi:hypothetical protein